MIGDMPACVDCIHFDWNAKGGLKCKAFPKGIPDAIIFGEDGIHTKPFPGDHGIQFERKYIEFSDDKNVR